MESRLVILLVYFCAAVGTLSLFGYQKYFDPTRAARLAEEKKIREELEKKAALGQSSAQSSESVSASAVLDPNSPELAKGKEIYLTKGQCVTCHGDAGQGLVEQEAPKIAHQYDWYLLTQLKKMKAGERVNEKMNPYLANLTEDDFQEVVKYISALPKN